MRGEHLDDIIGAIYDAPVSLSSGTEAWSAAIQRIEGASGGACLLSWQDGASGRVTVAAPSLAPDYRRAYEGGHAGNSPWVKALLRLPAASIVTDAEINPADTDAQAGTDFFKTWMEPQRFRHGIASEVMREGAHMVVLKTLLPEGTPPTEDHIALHKALQPHLRRATTLSRQVLRRRAEAGMGESVLEQLSVAAFLAELDGRVTFMNEAATALIAAKDGVALDARGSLVLDGDGDGRLRPGNDPWRPFRRGKKPGEPPQRAIAMPVPRPSGRPDLHLMATLSDDQPLGPASPHLTILVTDPHRQSLLSLDRLMALYGFTRREAEIAARLAQGASIRDIGEESGTTESTIRWHIRCAFEKAGAHRQADLVRLIATNPLVYDTAGG